MVDVKIKAAIPESAIMYAITKVGLIPKNLIRIPEVLKAATSERAPTILFV